MKKIISLIAILSVLLVGCTTPNNTIKIGVITDLTGPASYWGESTAVGAELAVQELAEEGINVELIFEDYMLDSKKSLTAAQKLVHTDDVDAIFAEFNPAAVAVGSFVKDQDVLFVFDAAVTSPLKDSPLTFKTYLDYQEGCKEIAGRFKDEGIGKIGVLKVTLEFGDLCLAGVQQVFDEVVVQSYNLGDQDFRTQMLKFKTAGIEAVINVGFEGDTITTLKTIEELGLDIKFGTVADTITEKVKSKFSETLKGTWTFGFSELSPDFKGKLAGKNLATEFAAAIAFTHIKQMAKAINACDEPVCVVEHMEKSPSDETIGFKRFKNHIAILEMQTNQE